MDRTLELAHVEGEIALVVDYVPGQAKALDVLGGAMALIAALDALDAALLSSIDTELEPVSVLNDVQHSSLKILLARVLRSVPDDHLASLEWKKWIGGLLVKGKHKLLQKLDADAPTIEVALLSLEPDYKAAPGGLVGYDIPSVKSVQTALDGVSRARSSLGGQQVMVQSEYGDVVLSNVHFGLGVEELEGEIVTMLKNRGREFLKVRYPDMLGNAQWTVMRNGRATRVELLHRAWLAAYQARVFSILPGDSLDCSFEESIGYDAAQTEIERKLTITEVHGVVSPLSQMNLLPPP